MTELVLRADGLTKRYGRRTALLDCTLAIPAGRVTGVVGPNGAGKTTLLELAVGMLAPSEGSIEIFGASPAASSDQLAKVGYVAQQAPVYAGLSIADHVAFGARSNPRWENGVAEKRIAQLGLDPALKAGKLSGGQRAQLALALAMAKRPDLLVLDEPVASLDPIARRDFLRALMAYTAENGTSVILSSHLVSDLERVCDHFVVLAQTRVRLAGETEELMSTHYRLVGGRREATELPPGVEVVDHSATERQSTFIVRSLVPVSDPTLAVEPLTLEDLALAYMSPALTPPRPALEMAR